MSGEKPSWLVALEGRLRELGAELEVQGSILRVRPAPGKVREVAAAAVEAGFDHLASVEGIDWPSKGVIEVVYHAESYEPEKRRFLLEVRVQLPREKPVTPSLFDVWPNALFMERETWEMLGVVFEGHPELRRLLLPPGWEGPPPLRKDFKVVEEGIYVEYE